MKPVIAIVAPGNMGAGLAAVLTRHGVTVRTSLAGRSPATLQRAQAAGMQDVPPAGLVEADFLLSILPPVDALSFARAMAPHLAAAAQRPVFVDCNAKSPETAREIGAVITGCGTPFIDAAIIGLPPHPGAPVPRIFAAGGPAQQLAVLNEHGLDIRVLEGPVGAAAALKMSFAGINKGLTAVASAMILAATGSLSRQVPDMLPKAYRWVAEMREIAAFAGDDAATRDIFLGAAQLYERIARDHAGDRTESGALAGFFPVRASSTSGA
jgi:3-hydroxyisobutyrate dehydrogenase-like beta-hydroxyacid dehydrogenase